MRSVKLCAAPPKNCTSGFSFICRWSIKTACAFYNRGKEQFLNVVSAYSVCAPASLPRSTPGNQRDSSAGVGQAVKMWCIDRKKWKETTKTSSSWTSPLLITVRLDCLCTFVFHLLSIQLCQFLVVQSYDIPSRTGKYRRKSSHSKIFHQW